MKRFLFCFLLIGILVVSSFALARIGGGDIKYPVKRVGEVTFSHDTHVEAMGFNCTECHPIIFITKEEDKRVKMIHRRQSVSCGTCHDGKQAFDLRSNCYICHNREVK